jgi:glycosidase
MKSFFISLFLFLSFNAFSQSFIERVEPPFWWTGMQVGDLQLLVHGDGVGESEVAVIHEGIQLKAVNRVKNPNYLFIDLYVSPLAEAGSFNLLFRLEDDVSFTYQYELKERAEGSADRAGFSNEDVIYLAMPDRFANGDPGNDHVSEMLEKADRANPDGRHGGDLQGIINHLDYIQGLGATAIWINPVLENNMPAYSYHGYAITDFYRVDPRYGGNEKYLEFVEGCHERGIKVIMDQVFNHCGSYHWWMKDLPEKDWIHQFPEFTRSNYRGETVMDPYATDFDRERMLTGWFDKTMPDLDQQNEYLANYLIQNSIWWIEYGGIDGIRMDTYPYSYSDFMVRWIKRVRQEYPNFTVVGEAWLQKEAHTAYFLENSLNSTGYDSHLPVVTDFPLKYALTEAFTQNNGWTTGISRLYYVLSQDYLYSNPMHTLIFVDNHDLDRFYTSINEDLDDWKTAMAILMTTRGIPMIYYGTEILMTGEEHKGHGFIREDFPGGWPQDTVNCFIADGRNDEQNEAFDYLRKLINWRNGNEVIHEGKLKHYIPNDGLYVYFRYTEDDAVMVVVNNHKAQAKMIDPFYYSEVTEEYQYLYDVMEEMRYGISERIVIPARSARIFELE